LSPKTQNLNLPINNCFHKII